MPLLLIVDDDPATRESFRLALAQEEVAILQADTIEAGLETTSARRPDAIVLNVDLPGADGLQGFDRFRSLEPKAPMVLLTSDLSADTTIEAMRQGAQEIIVKPLDPRALRPLVLGLFKIRELKEVPAEVSEIDPDLQASHDMVGRSAAMRDVYKAIGRVAKQDVTVLILGESGTGKELVARAIYDHSHRAAGPFLTINCAAIPETLLESELFGHEKGAFTGADRKRIGKFEQCNGGTLFLDEIGDMTPLTQTKILRVLQEKRFERVGGNELIHTDVRILAATNRNLEAMIASGEFRSDLFYRLNVYTISLPPLRERPEDIPLLVDHFLHQASGELGKEFAHCSPEALEPFTRYSWPGNVRELQSVVKQTLLEATAPVIMPDFLPPSLRGDEAARRVEGTGEDGHPFPALARFIRLKLAEYSTNLHAVVQAETERLLMMLVLDHTRHNLTQAAKILGISRATLRNKLASLQIGIERSSAVAKRSTT